MYILKMFHHLSYYNLVMYMSLLNCVDGFNLQQDSSSIREQLVSDFIPIDGCPVGTQLTESPVHVHRSEDKNNKPREMVCIMHPPFVYSDISLFHFTFCLSHRMKLSLLYRRLMQRRLHQRTSLLLIHNLMPKPRSS